MTKFILQCFGLFTAGVVFAADTQPPAIQAISPPPGSSLAAVSQISVTFAEAVVGVDPEDLLINGEPAITVSVSGNTYTFTCSAPAPGFVSVYFDVDHGITDLAGNRFDESALGATWSYTLADLAPPAIARLTPPNNSVVRNVFAAEVTFNETVIGVTANDLLINGVAATNVLGAGAGPYRFSFPQPGPGPVTFSWAAGHGIQDPSGNAFAGGNWTIILDPAAPATVRINEFLAANENVNGLHDEDGELNDWIELFNYGSQPVNLAGWSLTDDPARARQWLLPAISLNAGQYLIVFASGKDRASTAPGARLHANFQLGAAGEYLALFNSDEPPSTAATEFNYPEQRIDYSYGYDPSDQLRYFGIPTPGAANGSSTIQDLVEPVHFSVSRGFFNAPFNLVLTTPSSGATIRYTLDGSPPTSTSGLVYTAPLNISNTTPVRAAAFRSNSLPSILRTHTYVFGDQVLRQPTNPTGFPSTWVTQNGSVIIPADYAMDPRIITNSIYTNLARQALTSIPSLSVVMKTSDLFSQANGIYANPRGFGIAWERPASAEFLFSDGSDPVQIDVGYRIQGGSSREETKDHKHSQRMLFRGAYGAGRFNYRFFNDSPVESFDTLVVDAGLNLVWTHRTDATQRRQGQYVRDQYVSDLHNAMGWPAFHGRFFHLYLNGLYWGLHGIHERTEEDFAASYFGGDETQWDVLKNTTAFEVLSGDINAWNAMRNLANSGLVNDAQYQQIQQYLDIESLVDYMILNIYTGNTDWPHHNWYVARRRQPAGTFKFFSWDAEHVLKSPTEDRSAVADLNTPAELYDQLRRNNAEFRLRFADRIHRYFFNDGLCATNQATARYMARIREIDPAIVLESARWGDNAGNPDRVGNPPYERNVEWLTELNRLLTTWFPQRSTTVLNQFRALNLYPSVVAPTFGRHGGRVARGFNLTMSAPAGLIYFTTNGIDPRVYLAGAPAPDAQRYTNAVLLSRTAVVKARALLGTNWSALNEATFTIEQLITPLRITEIMYNPAGGDAYEFIELRNLGDTPLDVSGFSFTGITWVFPAGSVLSPGQTIVLAADVDPNAFAARYPGVTVFGYFSDRLANGGERIAIKTPSGETITSVDYNDGGQWPHAADGFGYSLEVVDPFGNPDQPASWRASPALYGSPGLPTTQLTASVIVNEVMANNAGAVTNGGTFPGWIELLNTAATNVNLSDWSLSNDSNTRRFVFAPGTVLSPGAYVVVWCDFGTDTNSGLHAPIALEANGDTVSLYDASTNRVDAISFGNQVANYTIGRIGGQWQLCSPTPNALNIAATAASSTNVVINEWLANAPQGADDWIEVYNSSSSPASLYNFYIGVSNSLFQIQSLTFIPPLGYVQLFADERPGPDHLDFKLPAAGGAITLYDPSGTVLSRVNYGPQTEGVSQGRLPDGNAAIQNFPGSASPGAANYVISYSGPFLNEVMARNAGAVRMLYGTVADWVELYNPATTNMDLSDMRLSVDVADPNQWRFPAGATVPAQGYLIVWCTSLRPTSTSLEPELNTGHGIDAQSGSVFLFNAQGQVVDSVEFSFQVDDQTIGRSGGQWRLLATPTPGAANSPEAQLGSPALLTINEWMAAPVVGDDWFELYNTGNLPVALSGLFLTDDPSISGVTNHLVAPLSFIGPNRWVRFFADGDLSRGRDHVSFALDSLGETIRLYNTNLQLIDSVDFGLSQLDVSEGRLPDGASRIVKFPGSPSPAAANYLPMRGVLINEILVDGSGTSEQAVELYNPTSQAVDIGNWWLSDSAITPRKFRIPAGTVVPPGGFQVFFAAQFGSTNNGEPLIFPTGPGEAWLFESDEAGNLSGSAALAAYGVTSPGQSWGRGLCGVLPFSRLVRPTFGIDFPSSVEQFRLGTGAVNAQPIPTDDEPPGAVYLVEQPLSRVVPTGSSVLLYVGACGNAPLTYRWFLNSTPVADATNAVLQLSNVQSAGAGSYFAIVSNSLGVATSAVAQISLAALPAITTQPRDWTTNSGNQATFSILAQGSGLTYQWRFNAVPIEGANASVLTLSNLTVGNSGDYSVVVGNTAGAIASDTAHLTVTPSLQITAQPQSRSVLPGSNVVFSVGATGTGLLRYQWYFNSNVISGATSDILNVPNAQLANHGFYFAEVTDNYGSVRSQPAFLTVRVAPSILQQPASATAVVGSDFTFSVTVTGTPPLGYRWRRNAINVQTRVDDPTLTITNVQPSHAGTYSVIVTNLANTTGVLSSNATLSVVIRPLLLQPRLVSNQFEVFLRASTGSTHVVESSANLTNWTQLQTLVPTNSDTRIVDPGPGSNRFYRARLVP